MTRGITNRIYRVTMAKGTRYRKIQLGPIPWERTSFKVTESWEIHDTPEQLRVIIRSEEGGNRLVVDAGRKLNAKALVIIQVTVFSRALMARGGYAGR